MLHGGGRFTDDLAREADYLVARAADVPVLRTYLFEFDSPGNPLGAKGAGEAGLIGAGAAVANAVADAVGEAGDSIYELPIRPETVHGALRSMSTGGPG
jgi:carbon-monoxide dehydrogenase large subunit